jgi:hypothetical protein
VPAGARDHEITAVERGKDPVGSGSSGRHASRSCKLLAGRWR